MHKNKTIIRNNVLCDDLLRCAACDFGDSLLYLFHFYFQEELFHKLWSCSTNCGTVPLCVSLLGYNRILNKSYQLRFMDHTKLLISLVVAFRTDEQLILVETILHSNSSEGFRKFKILISVRMELKICNLTCLQRPFYRSRTL